MKAASTVAMRIAPWAIPVLTIGIFVFDLLTPVGVAVSVLYVIPLLLTVLSSRERDPVYFSIVVTSLIWIDLFLKPVGIPIAYGAFNRALGTFVMWGVALGLIRYKRVQHGLMDAEAGQAKVAHELISERVERAHAEGLMMAAQEARVYADTAVLGAAAGRREAEEQLLITRLHLQGIIQSAMDAIITVDDEQHVVLFNQAAEKMFQCSAVDAIGSPLERFIPSRFRGAHHRHVHAFGQSGATSRKMGQLGTVTGVRADEEEFPIEAAISHFTVEGKKHYTVILRDVTERDRLSAQLRKAERLAELGTLASGMAHEIGTPMNVILGRAEYLIQRVTDEGTKKGLATIVTQVERITKVMNQLLAFARRKTPERRTVDLGQTIDDSLELFQERMTHSRITVEKAIEANMPSVYADPDQLTQVLINLVMNSVHAMPEGGQLRLSLDRENGHARLGVSDTGHGMPEAIRSKIFEPFFTTKDFGKGTGLGLTVVKGIIEEHGGTIDVESAVDKGTTFWIRLPLDGGQIKAMP
jgi:PAS domain S-box-containing protein